MRGSTPLLLAIIASAAVLRLFPIWFGLPHLYTRPDEEVAVGKAVGVVLRGQFNPQFFHWPSLTFYLFAALFGIARALRRLAGLDPALTGAQQLLIARGAVACAGTLTVYVLFRMGRRVGGDAIGLISALFLSVAVLHVRDSHFAMTDILMTFFATTSLALILRALDLGLEPGGRRLSWFAAAGAVGGLAASTKYNGAAVLAGMGAAQLLLLWRAGWRSVLSPRAWTPVIVFVVLFAAAFVLATPYAVLDYPTFKADLVYDFTHLSLGHTIDLGVGWIYHATRSLPYGAGFGVFAAAIGGLVPLIRRYPRPAWVLLVFFAVFYVGIGNGRTVFFRYVLPLVPPVCLFAAIGVWHAGEWAARRWAVQRQVAVASLALLVAAPSAVNAARFDIVLARKDTRVIAREWLEPHLTPDSTLHDAGGEYAHLDLGGLRYHQWYFDEASETFGHPGGRSPEWLVLPESPVESYTRVPIPLKLLAARDYDLVHLIRGTGSRRGVAMYDQQDAFFVPVSGFSSVERPGPTIRIYRLRN